MCYNWEWYEISNDIECWKSQITKCLKETKKSPKEFEQILDKLWYFGSNSLSQKGGLKRFADKIIPGVIWEICKCK